MVDKDYDDYSLTKTYSLKLKNVKKVDKKALEDNSDKSKALNKIIEEYK